MKVTRLPAGQDGSDPSFSESDVFISHTILWMGVFTHREACLYDIRRSSDCHTTRGATSWEATSSHRHPPAFSACAPAAAASFVHYTS